MKKYLIIFVSILSFTAFVGCSEDDNFTPPNYVTFENGPLNVGVEVDGSTVYDVIVYTANITGSDRTFNVSVDTLSSLASEGYTVPGTVTIPANSNEGTFSVDVSDKNLGLAGKKLILNISGDDGVLSGSSLTLNVNRTCEGKEFIANFIFDDYASETSWSILDASGEVIIEVDGYDDGAETASKSLCLSTGNYTFVVEDAYGDGLTYPNVGSITLSYAGEEIVNISGDYGAGASVDFSI